MTESECRRRRRSGQLVQLMFQIGHRKLMFEGELIDETQVDSEAELGWTGLGSKERS